MIEVWQTIPQAPRYSVSNTGRVRRGNRLLKNSRDRNGYAVVNLHHEGRQTKAYVHRLVAEGFLPEPPSPRHHVAHWDGDGMNAAAINLRWATQSENEGDKRRHGRANYSPKGSRTIPATDIPSIRDRIAAGASLRSVAREYGVAHNVVAHALRAGSIV